MNKSRWRETTKSKPCPACSHGGWCAFSPDGRTLRCMRAPEAQTVAGMVYVGDDKGGGRLFRFIDDVRADRAFTPRKRRRGSTAPPTRDAAADDQPQVLDWVAEAERWARALSADRRGSLEKHLGVSSRALSVLNIGWVEQVDLRRLRAGGSGWRGGNYPRGAYTFIETDGAGAAVGVALRAEDGRKGFSSGKVGARRGLIVPNTLLARRELVVCVEGASDVLACETLGIPAVGRPHNTGGAADLSLLLKNRDVLIVGENDQKSDGRWPGRDGAIRVARGLAEEWGRAVKWTMPPVGVKDIREWLGVQVAAGLDLEDEAACHTAGRELLTVLVRAATEAKSDVESGTDSFGRAGCYRETPDGIVWDKGDGDSSVEVHLTTFRARIVEEIVRDDGAERQLAFRIQAQVAGGAEVTFEITAERFAIMNWPIEHLGIGAIVSAGQSMKDRTRVAIQHLSKRGVRRRVTYLHLGWREFEGHGHVFLHAGGAIGADGPVGEVEVEAPQDLARYVLPAPPEGDDLQAAVRASLDLINLGPARVTVPCLAGVYRAVVDGCDFSLHCAGSTGSFKSSASAVCLSHFGSFTEKHLPASWASTDNALEALAFAAMNVPLVIDDFAPNGTASDVQKLHSRAERIFRAAGNQQGRARLTATTSFRPTKYPRGLVWSTGEEIPNGHSIRARVLMVEFRSGDITSEALLRVQRLAATGVYARAMSAFLKWLAPQLTDVRRRLADRTLELREQAYTSGQHRRTPGIVADLQGGMEIFTSFAVQCGAFSEADRTELLKESWAALGGVAQAQAGHQEDADAVVRFQRLIAAAIASGQAHVASAVTQVNNAEDEVPENPSAWGWRLHRVGTGANQRDEWQTASERVGWTDGENLYLNIEVAHRVANRTAGDTPLAITARTLSKRMAERGILASRGGAERVPIQVTLHGSRPRVLHLPAAWLSELVQLVQPVQHPRLEPGKRDSAPVRCTSNGGGGEKTGAEKWCSNPAGALKSGVGASSAPVAPVAPVPGAKGASSCGASDALPSSGRCGHKRWWRNKGEVGPATCAVCHPPAAGLIDIEWLGSASAAMNAPEDDPTEIGGIPV